MSHDDSADFKLVSEAGPAPEQPLTAVSVGSGALLGAWIDVRKEIPIKGQPVLVVHKGASVPFMAWRDCDVPDSPWRDSEWIVFDDDDVTHWMPLPPLPNLKDEPRA